MVSAVIASRRKTNPSMLPENAYSVLAQCNLTGFHTVSRQPFHPELVTDLHCSSAPTIQPNDPHSNMATDATNIDSSRPSTAEGDDVVHAAVQTQLSLVSAFEQFLAQRIEPDADLKVLVSRLRNRLAAYRRWLCEIEQTSSGPASEDAPCWSIEARLKLGGNNETMIVVTGSGLGEEIQISAEDRREAEGLLRVCIICIVVYCSRTQI
jgi:hypothetical protein